MQTYYANILFGHFLGNHLKLPLYYLVCILLNQDMFFLIPVFFILPVLQYREIPDDQVSSSISLQVKGIKPFCQ